MNKNVFFRTDNYCTGYYNYHVVTGTAHPVTTLVYPNINNTSIGYDAYTSNVDERTEKQKQIEELSKDILDFAEEIGGLKELFSEEEISRLDLSKKGELSRLIKALYEKYN